MTHIHGRFSLLLAAAFGLAAFPLAAAEPSQGGGQPGDKGALEIDGRNIAISKASTASEFGAAFRRVLAGAMFYDPRVDAA